MHMVMFDKKETNKYSSIADIVKVSEKLYNFIIKLLKVRKYLQMLFPISYYIVKN